MSLNEEVKTQFITREGCYRLLNLSEYSRPNRVGYQSNQNSPQVRLSFVSLPQSNHSSQQQQQQSQEKASTSTHGGSNGAPANSINSNNLNGNNSSSSINHTTSNGPVNPPSNLSSSSATNNATVTSLTNGLQHENSFLNQNNVPNGDWICFNFGKELYTYSFRGVKKAADLSKPIDKKLYKGTNPSCHDFNQTTATSDGGAPLLVGFTTGQIQLIYPGRRGEQGKLYNEERLIDKTKVTCLKWLPNSKNLFLAAHASGHLYLYNEELPCTPAAPVYQPFKCGEGFSILTCKSKSTRNPLYKWSFGIHCNAINGNHSSSSSSSSSSTISSSSSSYSCASDNCSINEFCFSPDGSHFAIASQDGFLRIFHYDTMELVGLARSYFGGFLCVCWSPDSKYVVVGGEDDLVTIYSFLEKRVVARGQGHRSWVSVVAFDPYTTFSSWDSNDFSDDENQYELQSNNNSKRNRSSSIRDSTMSATGYRLGSVSQDTQLCLWDITEDVLRPHHRLRLSTLDPTTQPHGNSKPQNQQSETVQMNGDCSGALSPTLGNKESNENNSLCNSTNSTQQTTAAATSASKVSNSSNIGDGPSTVSAETSSHKKSKSTSLGSVIGNSSSNSNLSATRNGDEKSNNHSAFNTLTQRLTNFSFSGEKGAKKKHLGLKNQLNSSLDHKNGHSDGNSTSSILRNKNEPGFVTFDAMKLIGTPSCPRFDDCPVLEPLSCKKIAQERLTALIFREDCFLTACQDGFVYTWARPNSSHLATNSPTAPHSSSTIV